MGKFILRSKMFLQVLKISETGSHRSSGQKDPGGSSLGFPEIRIMRTGLFTITEKK